MKRDMDLCRRILLEVDANPGAVGQVPLQLDIEGRDPQEVSYHVLLLNDAGLIEARNMSNLTSFDWRPERLTYAGHEFIDKSRKDSVWQKAKGVVLEKTGGLSLDVLKAVLAKLATDAVLGGGS
jgi:hypothetical protein